MGHFTTRFATVFGLSFTVLLLIPLWVVFGTFSTGEGGHAEGGAHGAMAGMDDAQMMFIEQVQAFAVNYTRPDGCVDPAAAPMAMAHQAESEEHHSPEAEHRAADDAGDEHAGENPVVYLQARQWGYTPARLCLKAGTTYQFRMMATDVIHGASIQLGPGGKMVRLPPGIEVVQEVTFAEPGEYLLYCSYYCGLGHQFMKGQIIVEPGPVRQEHTPLVSE